MCNLENFEDKDKCILYIDNPIKDLKQFSEELQMYKNEAIGEFLYKDIVFPRGFDLTTLPLGKKTFSFCNFYEEVLLEGSLKFFNCNFFEEASTFYFDKERRVTSLLICNCIFEKSFSLSANSKKEILIDYINISDSLFESGLDIDNIKIDKIELKNNYFYKTNIFKDLLINFFEINYNTFDSLFINSLVTNDELDLSNNIFINVPNIKINNKNLKNRETARIIKNSFEQQNNIIEANKFYALEMQKMEEELKKAEKVKISEWLIFKIHGLTSNHSQDWLLALFWILSLSFGLAFVNCVNEYLDTKLEYILIDTLVYSIVIILSVFIVQKEKINNFFLIVLFYLIYGLTTKDFTLYNIVNNINPFSIMTEFSELTFLTLVYKITIAYLIYQLIVSIRQNTRRK